MATVQRQPHKHADANGVAASPSTDAPHTLLEADLPPPRASARDRKQRMPYQHVAWTVF